MAWHGMAVVQRRTHDKTAGGRSRSVLQPAHPLPSARKSVFFTTHAFLFFSLLRGYLLDIERLE